MAMHHFMVLFGERNRWKEVMWLNTDVLIII